jgi:hypothetical protein
LPVALPTVECVRHSRSPNSSQKCTTPRIFLCPRTKTKCLDRDKVSRASHLSPLHPSHLNCRPVNVATWFPPSFVGVAPRLTASPSIPRSLCANMTACVHPWFHHIFHLCLGLCYYTIRRLYLFSPHGYRGPCRGLFSPSSTSGCLPLFHQPFMLSRCLCSFVSRYITFCCKFLVSHLWVPCECRTPLAAS